MTAVRRPHPLRPPRPPDRPRPPRTPGVPPPSARTARRTLLLAALACLPWALWSPGTPAAAAEAGDPDPYDTLRHRWLNLSLGTGYDPAAEPYASRLRALGDLARAHRATMSPAPGSLWPGQPFDPPAGITRSYARLWTMARAYVQEGTGLTGDPGLSPKSCAASTTSPPPSTTPAPPRTATGGSGGSAARAC